jgi:WD40 repeat protein
VTQDRELRVLTGSFDKTLRLWDGDGSSLARFQGHAGLVTAVAITKVLIV